MSCHEAGAAARGFLASSSRGGVTSCRPGVCENECVIATVFLLVLAKHSTAKAIHGQAQVEAWPGKGQILHYKAPAFANKLRRLSVDETCGGADLSVRTMVALSRTSLCTQGKDECDLLRDKR